MSNYLVNKYNIEETDIQKLVLNHNYSNTYEQIYVKSGGIDEILILKFIATLIFLHPISNYENYWKNDFMNMNNLLKYIKKTIKIYLFWISS